VVGVHEVNFGRVRLDLEEGEKTMGVKLLTLALVLAQLGVTSGVFFQKMFPVI
jgi:hypothetical protein